MYALKAVPFRGAGMLLLLLTMLASGCLSQIVVTNLVTNSTDPDLVNAWGISRSSGSPWWVADNATGKATLYNAAGVKQGLVVTIPGFPTGTVFYGGTGFIVPETSKPALFLFVTVTGQVVGWNGSAGTTAKQLRITPGASYTGMTIASRGGKDYLYAADFHNGKVDIFDSDLNPVSYGEQAFELEDVENLGFAPFNIQNIGGVLFVTYAKQDAAKMFDVPGDGNGYVAAFTLEGKLIRRFEHGRWLSSPWGLTMTPSDFGSFSHTILVGMFGNGGIAAYNFLTGKFLGLLSDTSKIRFIFPVYGESASGAVQIQVRLILCTSRREPTAAREEHSEQLRPLQPI